MEHRIFAYSVWLMGLMMSGMVASDREICPNNILQGIAEAPRRCPKCEERDREKRQRLAQVILAGVAQFFQGMLTLAHGGKELDDKVKVEQGVLMMQAVGNIIYQAQEYDRHYPVEPEIVSEDYKGTPSATRRSAFIKLNCDQLRRDLVDLIVANPEYVMQVVSNELPITDALRWPVLQQQHELSSPDDSSLQSSESCGCCSRMSKN